MNMTGEPVIGQERDARIGNLSVSGGKTGGKTGTTPECDGVTDQQ